MGKVKAQYYKAKSLFFQVCLIVGVFTVAKYTYNMAQDKLNTVENKLACNTTKQISPSYIDKLECSAIAALDFSKKVTNEFEKAVK